MKAVPLIMCAVLLAAGCSGGGSGQAANLKLSPLCVLSDDEASTVAGVAVAAEGHTHDGTMCIYGDPKAFAGDTQVRIDRQPFTGGQYGPETGFLAITPKGTFRAAFYETSRDTAFGVSADGQRVGLHVEGSELDRAARQDAITKAMGIIMERYQAS